jgi:hypothetical protein
MTNLIARRSPNGPHTLLITHYDTKNLPGVAFVGANDGASGVAVLLELARVTCRGAERGEPRARFFDGEEAFGPNITEDDGSTGAKAPAQRQADDGHRPGARGRAGRHGRRPRPEPRARPALVAHAAQGVRDQDGRAPRLDDAV